VLVKLPYPCSSKPSLTIVRNSILLSGKLWPYSRKVARDKHSSLICRVISDEEKSFVTLPAAGVLSTRAIPAASCLRLATAAATSRRGATSTGRANRRPRTSDRRAEVGDGNFRTWKRPSRQRTGRSGVNVKSFFPSSLMWGPIS